MVVFIVSNIQRLFNYQNMQVIFKTMNLFFGTKTKPEWLRGKFGRENKNLKNLMIIKYYVVYHKYTRLNGVKRGPYRLNILDIIWPFPFLRFLARNSNISFLILK